MHSLYRYIFLPMLLQTMASRGGPKVKKAFGNALDYSLESNYEEFNYSVPIKYLHVSI